LVVGILTILIAFAIGIPRFPPGLAVIHRHQRDCWRNRLRGGGPDSAAAKDGVLLLLIAWPYRQWLLSSTSARPRISLLFVALLFAGANWKHFDEPLSNKRLKLARA